MYLAVIYSMAVVKPLTLIGGNSRVVWNVNEHSSFSQSKVLRMVSDWNLQLFPFHTAWAPIYELLRNYSQAQKRQFVALRVT